MLTYQQAVEQAVSGKPLHVSFSGGRSRYVHFEKDGDAVGVRLFRTLIAVFIAEGVTVRTGGYNTPTTCDALNALLGGLAVGTEHKVLRYRPGAVDFTEGMIIGYDGAVLNEGVEKPPTRGTTLA